MIIISDKGINIKVDEEFYKQIKIKVATDSITIKDYIIKLIKEDLNKTE